MNLVDYQKPAADCSLCGSPGATYDKYIGHNSKKTFFSRHAYCSIFECVNHASNLPLIVWNEINGKAKK